VPTLIQDESNHAERSTNVPRVLERECFNAREINTRPAMNHFRIFDRIVILVDADESDKNSRREKW
jgi:hypothetical protein